MESIVQDTKQDSDVLDTHQTIGYSTEHQLENGSWGGEGSGWAGKGPLGGVSEACLQV